MVLDHVILCALAPLRENIKKEGEALDFYIMIIPLPL